MKTLNRKRFITLSAIAAGFISLFSFCFASWTFVQDKDVGFGFQSSEAKPVAYIVGKNEKYSSIEKAVSVANGLDSSKKIGYQTGTTGEYYVTGDESWGFAGFDALGVGYSTGALAVQDLINGNALAAAGNNEYGRCDKGMVQMILAKLYLNAEV